MLPSELWRCIFVAWVVVGWFRGVMLHQQNNEGPSSSDSYGPASTDSANLQHNVIQADEADDSNFDQSPKLWVNQPNIQQEKENLQYNAIKANSVKKSNFVQRPIAEKVTHGTQPIMQQLLYLILTALIAVVISIATALGISTKVVLYICSKMKGLPGTAMAWQVIREVMSYISKIMKGLRHRTALAEHRTPPNNQ